MMNKNYELCTSSILNVNLPTTKIMIVGRNKRTLNQEAFYLSKDQIEIIHEYKYLGIDFYSHRYFDNLPYFVGRIWRTSHEIMWT